MNAAVRMLIVEDAATDAELAQRELHRAGLCVSALRVETRAALERAFSEFVPDVIVSDFSLPHLGGLEVLELARRHAPHIPFVFLSGTIGEETAIDALKHGAADYVLKTNMKRLAPAVRRALADAEQQRARAAAEARLHHLAFFDPLTDLPNRTLFTERLDALLAQRDGQRFSVVLADIERFRHINETFGRDAGDQVLREVVRRLRACVPAGHLLARIGPNAFIWVVLENESLSAAAALLRGCVAKQLAAPLHLGQREVRLSVKAGVAIAPDDGNNAEQLLRNAEAALKTAKVTNRRTLLYAREMNARSADKLGLETRLRAAIEQDQFKLRYQPQIDLASGATTGFEALIRWAEDGRDQLVPPGHFVPMLEETGLINEAGLWVIEEAVRQHASWRATGLIVPRLAVNVSEVQLRDSEFVNQVLRVVRAADMHSLEIEITESSFLCEGEDTINKLGLLRAAGIKISVDDFGTGFSSLSKVAHLPIDTIKIDQGFVHTMLANRNDRAVVAAIIALAQALELHTVAEGVERAEQATLLRQLGCSTGQGHLFAPALDANGAAAWMHHPVRGQHLH